MAGTILDEIIATKRLAVARAASQRPREALEADIATAPPPRPFFEALQARSPVGIHMIAEIKRRSPSAGLIRADFDPAVLAKVYEDSGASAISVLTDEAYFDGRLAYLEVVKKASRLPVLRKDFIIDAYQVYESRAAGADAILLIGEVLENPELIPLLELAMSLGMSALVEVHEADVLQRVQAALTAADAKRVLLGINNRNLKVQKVDLATTTHLIKLVRGDWPIVSESGIHTRAHVTSVQQAGASALLVGETLLRQKEPGHKISELLGTTNASNE